ncbi:glutathione S-transferase family protein [Aerophototrophica crusticola]|uniref:Glutathione S-transferase family protein n=1 Tax=Aerophototrophica crusticola TaxID=1709002 RepID=A0A858R3L6_9PROT|nr:glutathione S-transferase family protein [Rhodospirillaceae bacterium B3]
MLRLYDNITSGNGYKCRWLLTQLDMPFERVEVDIDKAESRTPAFLAINPNGRIPLLRLCPGDYLAESNAILRWIAEGTSFWPDNRRDKAAVLQWLFWEQYNHEPNIATARFWITHKVPMTPERVHALVLKREAGHAALKLMDDHLRHRDWLVGQHCTIADIALYAYTHVADEGGFDLGGYPAVCRWIDRFAQQPNHILITDRVGTDVPYDPATLA